MDAIDVAGLLSALPGDVGTYSSTAYKILSDPALPQVIELVQEISDASGPSTSSEPGIGLSAAIKPLQGFLFLKQHPVLGWLSIASFIVFPAFVGYVVGKRLR